MSFKDHPVVFAFQLITIPKKITDSEFDKEFWHFHSVHPFFNAMVPPPIRDFGYMIYYCSDMNNPVPNPTISQIWKEARGRKYTNLPWRGDVFVIKDYAAGGPGHIIKQPGIFSTQDVLEFFEALKASFQRRGDKYMQDLVELEEPMAEGDEEGAGSC